MGHIPNILFHPWEPVEDGKPTILEAAEETVKLHFVPLPPLEQAQALYEKWSRQKQEKEQSGAQDWEILLASEYMEAYRRTIEAVRNGDPPSTLTFRCSGLMT